MQFSHSTMPEPQNSGSPVTQIRGGTQGQSSTFPFGEPSFCFHRNLGTVVRDHVAARWQRFC